MRKLGLLAAASAFAVASGFVSAAQAQFGESVDSFSTTGSVPPGPNNDETNTLGAPDGTGGVGWFNLGTQTGSNGEIIIEFVSIVVVPGAGDDLAVFEAHSFGSGTYQDTAEVFVSEDCSTFQSIGNAESDPSANGGTFANNFDIDFGALGISFVKCVMIQNTGTPTNDPGADGFDVDAVQALNSATAGFSLDVEKTLTNSNGITDDQNPDFGTIEISLGVEQSYEFTIKITNNGGADAADGAVVFDVVPAEYNLDPAAAAAEASDGTIGDAANDGVTTAAEEEAFWDTGDIADANTANCVDSLCDGLDTDGSHGDDPCFVLSGGTDASCDGIVLDGICADGAECDGIVSDDPDACMPSASTSGGGGKKGGVGLEPEFITIEVSSDLGSLDMCTITVAVVTDENPSSQKGNKDLQFEPTGCHAFIDKTGDVIVDDTGLPIVDWIALNDGVKVFDPEDGLLTDGPTGSIQLRPAGCDTDGDGATDVCEVAEGSDPLDDTDTAGTCL